MHEKVGDGGGVGFRGAAHGVPPRRGAELLRGHEDQVCAAQGEYGSCVEVKTNTRHIGFSNTESSSLFTLSTVTLF